jgi:hypothetical protein
VLALLFIVLVINESTGARELMRTEIFPIVQVKS